MCVCVCMYVCVYARVCVRMWYIWAFVCMYICMYTCMYVCEHLYLCMHVCLKPGRSIKQRHTKCASGIAIQLWGGLDFWHALCKHAYRYTWSWSSRMRQQLYMIMLACTFYWAGRQCYLYVYFCVYMYVCMYARMQVGMVEREIWFNCIYACVCIHSYFRDVRVSIFKWHVDV
jgi:hypothetical protein